MSIEYTEKINEDLTLIEREGGLTFGTDAYLLSSFAKPIPQRACVELGGGTGIIPLLLIYRKKFSHVYSVEIQSEYASLIARNAELNGFSDKITSVNIDVRDIKGNYFPSEPKIDCVITNPPYMTSDSGKTNENSEMAQARREYNGTIYDFCSCANRILKHGGLFLCVYRPDRMAELFDAMKSNHIEPKRLTTVYPTPYDKPSLILVEGKKGAKPSLNQTRPLILYSDREKKIFSDDYNAIYSSCSMDIIK